MKYKTLDEVIEAIEILKDEFSNDPEKYPEGDIKADRSYLWLMNDLIDNLLALQ